MIARGKITLVNKEGYKLINNEMKKIADQTRVIILLMRIKKGWSQNSFGVFCFAY